MSLEKDFFEEQTEQSKVKTMIVSKYFVAWSRVLIGRQKQLGRTPFLRYVEPLAGPGRYKNGAASTPLKIIQAILENKERSAAVATYFNDKDFEFDLRQNVAAIPGVENLKYTPHITSMDLEKISLDSIVPLTGTIPPTLYFLDPWGYRVLTLEMISSLIEPFGCDCIFFLNIKRINAAFGDQNKRPRLNALFGAKTANQLGDELGTMRHPEDRYRLIVDRLELAVTSLTANHCLDFKILDEYRNPSHFLLAATKNQKAYDIMKNVFAGASSNKHQVKSFTFDPYEQVSKTPLMFDDSLEELKSELLNKFAGQRLRFSSLFHTDTVQTMYTETNYRDSVNQLEQEDRIFVNPPRKERKRGDKITCGPDVVITFPDKGNI